MINELPVPMTLPLFINDPRPKAQAALAAVLKGDLDTAHQIDTLGSLFKIRVWFEKPLFFKQIRRWKVVKKSADEDSSWISKELISGITTDCHVFNRITLQNGCLLYTSCLRSRRGYHFPLELATKWELVKK
jgi:hypothetical protein